MHPGSRLVASNEKKNQISYLLLEVIPLIRGMKFNNKISYLLLEVLPLIRGMHFDNFKKPIKINELAVKWIFCYQLT